MKKLINNNKYLILILFFGFFLRIFNIFNSPPSLYWDEVSIGYNSYSIAETLKDEHGNLLPVQAFTAYGDYKAPLYIYLTAPIVKLFGLNYLTVRLTSIISGTILILLLYLLAKEITPKNKKYPFLAALFICISPWSIQLSRAAFEANLATTLATAGTLFFVKSRVKPKLIFLSVIFFIGSMYAFNGTRYFLPIWIFFLGLWQLFNKRISINYAKYLIVSVLLGIILIIPLISFGLTSSGQLRFNEVNIFSDPEPVSKSNSLQLQNNNSIISKIIYNRRVFHAQNYFDHYLDHFSFQYLFLTGDINPRFSSQKMGQLYLVELILIFIGLIYLFKNKRKFFYFILFWILLSPIAASVARETPHALRTLHMLPALILTSSYGMIYLFEQVKKAKLKKILSSTFLFLILFQFLIFYSDYIYFYPKKFADSWQDGYRQMSESLKKVKDKYPKILVTDEYGRAYANLLYYWRYSPEDYTKTRKANSEPSGLWNVYGFSNISFKPTLSCADSNSADLLVGTPSEFRGINNREVIFDSFNRPKFVMINSNDCKK
ncbi:glycosyltransferase family 39 protein [Candidatus Curtissbacteria bacterium]|nr:glycosyltransferase family 39 protein [Candidatus Curtissbacteria bacterium]